MLANAQYQNRQVLVTGASGYIGGALVTALKNHGSQVTRVSRQQLAPIPGVIDQIGDLDNLEFWQPAVSQFDIIFHLAGLTSVYAAEHDPGDSLLGNVMPLCRIIEAAQIAGVQPFVLMAGTATEAGLTDALPVDESVRDHPITTYDLHKLFAEKQLKLSVQRGVIKGTCLRLANVYGPSVNMSAAPDRGVINMMVRRGLAGKAISIYGDGSQIRDYIFINDVVAAFLIAGKNCDVMNGRHFFIGSGQRSSIRHAFALIAERIEKANGIRPSIELAPWPDKISPIEFRNFVADSTAFRQATGWKPSTSLTKGLDLTIQAEMEKVTPIKDV